MKPENKKYYIRIFFYGLFLALTVLVVFAVLYSLKINYPYIAWPIAWLTTIGLTWYFVQFLKIKKLPDFFPYALSWIVLGISVHYLITYKFVGLALFKNLEIWINYSLIILTGFASIKFNSKK